jgi:hypothetical protein
MQKKKKKKLRPCCGQLETQQLFSTGQMCVLCVVYVRVCGRTTVLYQTYMY